MLTTLTEPDLAVRQRVNVLHPLAWWAWAVGAIVAVTRTDSPLAVTLLTSAVITVALQRRSKAPWTRVFWIYLGIAGAVIILRLGFYVLFGIRTGGAVLIPLPAIPLPDWAGGISLLGPIEVGGVLNALYGAIGLASIIVCFGAANALANPKHVLRHLPGALHDLSTAVVIAVTVTPQLIASLRTVRRARRLRGVEVRGARAALQYVQPVLHDAMDRAIALAASMDSRGYAHGQAGSSRGLNAALLLAVILAGLGTYGVLDTSAPRFMGVPFLAAALAIGSIAIALASHRVKRTRYRPITWGARETVAALSGLAAAVAIAVFDAQSNLVAQEWAGLSLGVLAGSLLLYVPALLGKGGR